MTRKHSPTHYELLEVEAGDDVITIRLAYRRLAAMYHPDNEESGNPSKFKGITDAWRVLSHPLKRAEYDDSLKQNSVEIEVEIMDLDFTP